MIHQITSINEIDPRYIAADDQHVKATEEKPLDLEKYTTLLHKSNLVKQLMN